MGLRERGASSASRGRFGGVTDRLAGLVSLSLTVAVCAGFLFMTLNRPSGGAGAAGDSSAASDSPWASLSDLPGDSPIDASPTDSIDASPSASTSPSPMPLATYGPPGKFMALSPTTPSPMWLAELPDGHVLMAGGDPDRTAAYLFDPATGKAASIDPPSNSYYRAQSTPLLDGRVLFVGKFDASVPGPWGEVFDHRTDKFTATGPMSGYRFDFSVALLRDGRVLVVGGCSDNGYLDTAEIYDPATNRFTPTGRMTTPRAKAAVATLEGGKVLVAGGMASDIYPGLASAEIYDPATGKFTPTGSMSAARDSGVPTVLRDGRVLITGGEGSSQEMTQYADLYDPASGKFSRTGQEAVGRFGHTATLLGDGRVLIAGGYAPPDYGASRDLSVLVAMTESRYLASAELFDPIAGTFTKIGNMTMPRIQHSALLLRDGRVLIVGGPTNPNDAHLEVYVP